MKPFSIKTYLVILLLGIFLLPMAPVLSSDQGDTKTLEAQAASRVLNMGHRQGKNPLTQYIIDSVQCKNPEQVSFIIWGDHITDKSTNEVFSRLAAKTDFDIVKNIGDGQKVYIFYLLGNSRGGVYRPNFHFIKEQNKLKLVYKSQNVSTYLTNALKINGRYQISEGWRADLFNGDYDARVKLAWGSRVWFWAGTHYLPAYTDYTVKDAIDPSLLGTFRKWNPDTQIRYKSASRE